MEVFGFTDPRQGLLCAPGHYTDCTKFLRSLSGIEEDVSGLFKLKIQGGLRGYMGKTPVWSVFDHDSRSANAQKFGRMSDVPKGLIRNVNRIELDVVDEEGNPAIVSSFAPGGAWAWLGTNPGNVMHVIGSSRLFGHTRFFKIEETVPEHVIGHIWTRYSNMAGLVKAQRVEMLVASAKFDESSWRHCAARIIGECGMDEKSILAKVESPFDSLIELLKGLHSPKILSEGEAALECARRISALAMQSSALLQTLRNHHPKAPIAIDLVAVQRMKNSLPEKLTNDQVTVIDRVCELMSSPKAFSALLSGDVGTGKTLAYLIPAIAAHQAGAQVAIMAPTQLLADQLYNQLCSRFSTEIRGAQRIEASQTIGDPGYILVGTSGLVNSAKKSSWLPNLLICDEQHKMSTDTRERLVANWTHVLNVSATPIPRSLATALYEGMEILNLRQSPVRKEIRSHVCDMSQKSSIMKAIKDTLKHDERCAIVYPTVRVNTTAADDVEELKEDDIVHTVESSFEGFNRSFPGKVVMLHGKMNPDDVRSNIDRMRRGDAQIMIASTVIETGIDIPSVSLMVVRNAECFGISQLHQLRGRLVRNGGNGDFIMAVENMDDLNESSLARLNALAATTDGYELAERDLIQRGMGNFSGTAQSGSSPTVFRQIKLDVTDFMARKLKALYIESRAQMAMPVLHEPAEKRPSVEGQSSLF